MLLVATDKLNLLVNPRIEFIQACQDMAEIEDGPAVGVDLMKDVAREVTDTLGGVGKV